MKRLGSLSISATAPAAVVSAIAATSAIFAASCSLSAAGSGWEYSGGDAPYEEATSLFAEGDDGRVTFSTNDTTYHSPRGYTVWSVSEGLGGHSGDPFVGVSGAASKETGDASAGYGLVFCRGVNGSGDETMYVLLINVKRQFAVGKAVNGSYVSIRPWTESPALFAGWGAENRLRVTRDGAGGRFTVRCNGAAACEFESDAEVNGSGDAGYVVVISPYDDFPETTVKVVFSP